MKNKIFLNIALVLIVLIVHTSYSNAQNLNALYEEMEKNNFEIKSFDKEKEAIIAGSDQYIWLPDPEFSVGLFPLPVETRLGAQLLRISAGQMIPTKGIYKQQKLIHSLKAIPVSDQKNMQVLANRTQLKQEWLQLYKFQETQNIISRNIELLKSVEKIALSKVESGKGKLSEVVIVQIKINDIEERLKIIETQKQVPINNINKILSRTENKEIIIKDHLEFPIMLFEKSFLLEKIINGNPKLQLINHNKDVVKSEIDMNVFMQKPMYGVGFDYIYVNPRSDMDPMRNGRDALQLRASVKIPINKKPFEVKTKSQLIQIEALDFKERNAITELEKMMENAFSQYETALKTKILYEDQIRNIHSVIKLLEQEYAAENSGFENLISMEMDIIKYELIILDSIIEAHKAINILENLTL